MLKNLLKRKEGFTIIEVMIVLAIAGLIILIVFLAVPALQRNSRNTQRRNDVASILGVVNEYTTNQNGVLPAVLCVNATGTQVTAAGGTCAAQTNPVSVSTSGQFTTVDIAAKPAAPPAAAENVDHIYFSASCNGNAVAAGTARQIVAWFAVEPAAVAQCVQS